VPGSHLSVTDTIRNNPLRILAGVRRLPHKSEGERVVSFLEAAGCHVTPITGNSVVSKDYDAILLLGNAVWYPDIVKKLLSARLDQRPVVAVWHWEPLHPPKNSGMGRPKLGIRDIAKIVLHDARANDVYTNFRCLQKLSKTGVVDVLFASTPSRIEYLAEHGIKADYAPLGYDSDHGCDLEQSRDLPVLFLGDLRIGRRRRVLNTLRRRGVPVEASGDWSRPEFWGENRTSLLNRTRIFLNVHRFAGEFSGLRMILGMANGCLVISEPMYRPGPFLPGRHFVSVTVEEMPDAIQYYLSHDVERERIAREGNSFVMDQMRLETSVSFVLSAVKKRLGR
jgi:hypothetical protein